MARIRTPHLFTWIRARFHGTRRMTRFARWHIWLGWLVGLPILMWTVTGLVMVAKPIEEVRGTHLRLADEAQPLPASFAMPSMAQMAVDDDGSQAKSVATTMVDGQPVTRIEYMDGTVRRFDVDGTIIPALDEAAARAIVARQIAGGKDVASATFFEADDVPFDFRRPVPVWQVALADGTHVYVGRDTGNVEAVRTRWWRLFDTMWGLHIMDLQTREDTSHPILIGFAALAVVSSLLGCVLMFRRRKTRAAAPAHG